MTRRDIQTMSSTPPANPPDASMPSPPISPTLLLEAAVQRAKIVEAESPERGSPDVPAPTLDDLETLIYNSTSSADTVDAVITFIVTAIVSCSSTFHKACLAQIYPIPNRRKI